MWPISPKLSLYKYIRFKYFWKNLMRTCKEGKCSQTLKACAFHMLVSIKPEADKENIKLNIPLCILKMRIFYSTKKVREGSPGEK